MIQSDELHHSSGWLNHQPEDFPRKNMYGSWAISHCVFDYQRVGRTPGITWVLGAVPLEMVKHMAQLVDILGSAMWNGSAKKGGS